MPKRFNLDRIREELSYVDAVPLLALLGILVGFCSGLVILLFRFAIEGVLNLFLEPSSESFENLSPIMQGALPLTGAAILGAGFHWLSKDERRTGVAYVIERFHLYQGALSLRSLAIQFFSAAITLVSGLSMGREGPAVHLGAASGSVLGQWARLPNNSLRVLTSCGCAAAISASFNTPIAGVIFAVEVVMMEYHLSTVIPIILASVVGAVLTRAAYGHEPAFIIPEVQLGSLYELPFVVISGLIIGCLAAALIYLSRQFSLHSRGYAVGWRFLGAGAITAACGVVAPQILGIGYDSVNMAMIGGFSISTLFLVLGLKLLATSACVGLGLPAGVIGPSLVIGAMAGSLLGVLWAKLLPTGTDPTLYVLLGMAGMMAATLEAPLAALMALLELTFEANIIFPGMLVVVIASLVSSHILKQHGIFLTLLETMGISPKFNPLAAHLHRVGVAAVMDRNIVRVKQSVSIEEAKETLKKQPNWLLIETEGLPSHFMPAADLSSHLSTIEEETPEPEKETETSVNLLEIPGSRDNLEPVLLSATLQEALEMMARKGVSAVYVRRMSAPNIYRVFGLIRKQDIEHYYKP